MGELYGSVINATAKTSAVINKTFTASGSYTIPAGYTFADAFYVGGGASGANNSIGGAGGASGYTRTLTGLTVYGGQVLNVIVGAGGKGVEYGEYQFGAGLAGSASYINGWGPVAEGGKASGDGRKAGSGGSGAGHSGDLANNQSEADGASNGNTMYHHNAAYGNSVGQGYTTRAWGAEAGTLYAGGGGGGRNGTSKNFRGIGGAGGGGNGSNSRNERGTAGAPNTGGGGGGDSYYNGNSCDGGTGIVLLKLY